MADISEKVELLKLALTECQATVRSYDTKAQIVGVSYIFALNIVLQLGAMLPVGTPRFSVLYVLFSWMVMIAPVAMFGFVLYPTRKNVRSLKAEFPDIAHALYIDPDQQNNPGQYLEKVNESNFSDELTHELFKISDLRELKRKRFLRALFCAGLALLVLFFGQLSRMMSV